MKKTLDFWFQKNAVNKPAVTAERIEQRYLGADNCIAELETKFARKRKTQTLKGDEVKYLPDFVIPSLSIDDSPSILTPQSSVTFKSSSSSGESIKSVRTSIGNRSSTPSLGCQRDRIEQVKLFDIRNGSMNYEVLKATKYGIQCEVCDLTLRDMSSIIRFDANKQLIKHCHIGSDAHLSGK